MFTFCIVRSSAARTALIFLARHFVCVCRVGFFFVVTDGGVPGKQKRDLVSLFPVSLSVIYSFIFTKCFILVMVDPDSIAMIRTLSVRQEYTLDGTQWDTFWYVAGLY